MAVMTVLRCACYGPESCKVVEGQMAISLIPSCPVEGQRDIILGILVFYKGFVCVLDCKVYLDHLCPAGCWTIEVQNVMVNFRSYVYCVILACLQ